MTPSTPHQLEDSEQTLKTFDLGASAALICSGFELLDVDKTNRRKALFVFRRNDGIEDLVDRYWSDRLVVKARAYFDTIKMLKNRLYSD